jgi:hypothetical protein
MKSLANFVEIDSNSHQRETMHQPTGQCEGSGFRGSGFRNARQESGRNEPPGASSCLSDCLPEL